MQQIFEELECGCLVQSGRILGEEIFCSLLLQSIVSSKREEMMSVDEDVQKRKPYTVQFSSVQFSSSVMSDSL